MAESDFVTEADTILQSITDAITAITSSSLPPSDPSLSAHQSAIALGLARLRGVNSAAYEAVKSAKEATVDARDVNDRLRLKLDALSYQGRHLESEIATCRATKYIYHDLELCPIAEFLQRHPEYSDRAAAQESRARGGDNDDGPVAEEDEELMLARIEDELQQRRLLEDERKKLSAEKAAYVQENKLRQQELDALDRQYKQVQSAADAFDRALENH